MKITSAAEMRTIDQVTSEKFGVPSLVLMENAGAAVARFILREYPECERIGVVCGKGNNGGDGFVLARKLAETGRSVRILLACDPSELKGDAAAMFDRLRGEQATFPVTLARYESDLESEPVREILASPLLADALLGTGFKPPVKGLYAAVIRKVNEAGGVVVAVDIPSGADADAMAPRGEMTPGSTSNQKDAIARADAVVTFTAPRPAHVFAGLTAGPTLIAGIGSPGEAIVSSLGLNLSTAQDFASLLAPRPRESNKGSYGHVLVVGGSLGKSGAAAMAGFAALRAGAGLATVATPRSARASVAGFHPELMTEAMEETATGTIAESALDPLATLAEKKTVIAIGPGISRHPETAAFVRHAVCGGAGKSAGNVSTIPSDAAIVIDADALNAFEGEAAELNGRERRIVITPHPGEMSRLTGLSIAEIQAKRLEVARQFAREHELVVVLKGHRTLVAAPDGTVWVNATGNPGMSTGGTGDVLTGMVAGLIAQHPQQVLRATALAVYLHGLAGDLACAELGEPSMVATDLIRFLPHAYLAAQAEAAQMGDEVRLHS